jgi:hypothetical protein
LTAPSPQWRLLSLGLNSPFPKGVEKEDSMPTVYTIGFQRKPLSEFITLLRQAGVDAVIDIRLRNTSQLSGYTKRDDLAFLLQEGFGIAYEHHVELAPDDETLDTYR